MGAAGRRFQDCAARPDEHAPRFVESHWRPPSWRLLSVVLQKAASRARFSGAIPFPFAMTSSQACPSKMAAPSFSFRLSRQGRARIRELSDQRCTPRVQFFHGCLPSRGAFRASGRPIASLKFTPSSAGSGMRCRLSREIEADCGALQVQSC